MTLHFYLSLIYLLLFWFKQEACVGDIASGSRVSFQS